MRPWLAVIILVGLLIAPGTQAAEAGEIPATLRMSAIPDENPTELMRIYAPFAEYL
jgi:ABC-type phosphate/phosphonate transport system substrate-binding protein